MASTLYPPAAVARYNGVARTLHWAIALAILFNLFTGIFGESFEDVWASMPSHKATGLLILVLSIARIGWRLLWKRPDYPAGFSAFQRKVAAATHGTFYLLMLILPVTGWIFSSAGKYPLSFYGLFAIPKLPFTKGMAIVDAAHETHELLGYGFAALVVLHIAAAVYHQWVLKDGTLQRML
ncbi:cytochrome b [Novosphingobium sp. FKTRR1]|uniref:cytochrome b n=1 Tax=Novosphingobium sp. FKTRR1 TaxID=2879118 RepID=UPI001CEFF2B9|nr:cytochrome b [Novosphingobium sp. FKTRR1]